MRSAKVRRRRYGGRLSADPEPALLVSTVGPKPRSKIAPRRGSDPPRGPFIPWLSQLPGCDGHFLCPVPPGTKRGLALTGGFPIPCDFAKLRPRCRT